MRSGVTRLTLPAKEPTTLISLPNSDHMRLPEHLGPLVRHWRYRQNGGLTCGCSQLMQQTVRADRGQRGAKTIDKTVSLTTTPNAIC